MMIAPPFEPLSIPRRKLVVANWKMHGNLAMVRQDVPVLAEHALAGVPLMLAPPAPYLRSRPLCPGQPAASVRPGCGRSQRWRTHRRVVGQHAG